MGCVERRKEIRRQRQRRKKLAHLRQRLEKATQSERGEIARKVRALSPGANQIIQDWGLAEVDR
ncbi:MAG: hypothetical protein A2W31_08060 [Planctomycetes bacterium RBG_16_64_10]|nr:MAG: hypothetical protein A2W31_08060 [Planctomycetes bacterium RBG_16_64_10]